jgi:hypothetical protein
MRTVACVLGVASIALPALAQSSTPEPAPLLHLTASFNLSVHESYALTAPLFGPQGERLWAGKHWDPQFIHPQPAADVDGAVFTIQHGPIKAVWVNTLLDTEGRHFQYVYFLPDLMVTVIDVRFTVPSPELTEINVTYTRTALTPEGNQHVIAMNDGDKTAGKEWQQALDDYLAASKSGIKR